LRRAGQLRDTVDELLDLARDTHPAATVLDLPGLLADLLDRWHGPFAAAGRRLAIGGVPDLPEVAASRTAVRQILDVVIDNAFTHGTGTTRVDVVDAGSAISIEVGDEGPGLTGDLSDAFVRRVSGAASAGDAGAPGTGGSGHGIGLALARRLAEAEGGRLVLRRAAPGPVFSLLLPFRSDSHDPAPS
jgi:signal transduction histidine kinase